MEKTVNDLIANYFMLKTEADAVMRAIIDECAARGQAGLQKDARVEDLEKQLKDRDEKIRALEALGAPIAA